MIPRRRFELYLDYVRRSDIHNALEARLRPSPAGRPRNIGVDVLLAGMIACIDKTERDGHRGGPGGVALTKVHALLTQSLDRRFQQRLGIRDREGITITLRQVRYLWTRICDSYEFSPARRPDLDDHERDSRREALQDIIDQLLDAAVQHVGRAGRYAVDASAFESAARGKRSNRQAEADTALVHVAAEAIAAMADTEPGRAHDPDARYGYRTKTYANKTNLMFGYQLFAFTGVPAVGGPDRPKLTERITVLPGNARGITESVAMCDRFTAAGTPVQELISDRGFTYADVDDWARPLAQRGIPQVLDMHDGDRGARPSRQGYVMIDGWAHCPSIPDHLVRITRPARFTIGEKASTPEKRAAQRRLESEIAEFNRLIAERTKWRFEKMGSTSSGNIRMRCPARAGKIACTACPLSQMFEDVPETTPPPGESLPKACAQETVTIKPEDALKLRQAEYWGSPEWQTSMNRRSAVEAEFGILKAPQTFGIVRGWTHQVGLVKTTWLLALAVATANLHLLLKWAADNGDTRDPLTGYDTSGHGFLEVGADGEILDDTGPPDA